MAVKIFTKQIQSGPGFTEEPEFKYFQYYCEDVAAQIQGPLNDHVWDRLIPQASEGFPFVRHAIVALGALSRSRRLAGSSKEPPLFDPHRQYALAQYCKALRGMRESLTGDFTDGRKALISCLLVFCFESLQGHPAAASVHAGSLVTTFFQWRWASADSKLNSPIPGECSQRILLEDELTESFAALDTHALLFVDTRPTYIHRKIKTDMNEAVDIMPPEFTTVEECSNYWSIIMRRNFHFTAEARAFIANMAVPEFTETTTSTPTMEDEGSQGTPNSTEEEDDGLAIMRPENNVWSHPIYEESTIPAALLTERAKYEEDIWKWRRASAKVFALPSCQKPSPDQDGGATKDFMKVTLHKIHASMSIVLLARTFYPPEIALDAYLSEFQTTIDLAEDLAPFIMNPTTSILFRFDVGIIAALSQTVAVCRDVGIRDRTIKLLFSRPGYREGIWDSFAVGLVGKWLRDIEEEWRDDTGFIPAERRASLTNVQIKLHERTAALACKQKCGPRVEDVIERFETLNW
jgi:hypothetical protein